MSYVIRCSVCDSDLALTIDGYEVADETFQFPGSEGGDVVVVEDESECVCDHSARSLQEYFHVIVNTAGDIY